MERKNGKSGENMRRAAILLAGILLLLTLTGCGSPDSGEKGKTVVVGFSQLGAESGWRIANTRSMEDAARTFGYTLMMENANQKQDRQIAAIRQFIAYQVDVIVFSPIVETGWDNVLTEAKQAGIPVILMDRMIATQDDSLYTVYVGADFYAEGRRAGEYLIRKADAIGAEHLRIAEICGTTDSTPMRDRQRGFMDVIGKDERFTIVDSVEGDFLRSKGEERMRELLEKYGTDGIDVVFAHNDAMMLGALDVLDKADAAATRDMILITVDGEKDAVDALKAGRVNCVVQCTPDLGPAVMELVGDLKAGRKPDKVTHPEESYFSDFDDLTDPRVEGF